jgi:uncharacterized protein (TIGR03067 family)
MSTTSRTVRRVSAAQLIGCMAILVASLSFAKGDQELVKKLFQRLEGRWKVASAEVAGEAIKSDEEWSFANGNYKWSDASREIRGSGAINYTWDPHQIYFIHEHSSVTGRIETGNVKNRESGIYKLSDNGNTLTVCLGRLPSKEFTTTKEDKRRLFVLKRIQEDKQVE